MNLKRIVERTDTAAGRAFDFSIQSLIVLSLVSFAFETLPGLTQDVDSALGTLEVIVVAVFTAEYLLRLAVADRRLRFVFSFFGLVDLAAILPFYLATGVDLRSIRVFRLLRLFRAFKLVRYSRAIQRLGRAFSIAREEFVLFFSVSLGLLYAAAVGMYYFEHGAQPEAFASVFHSLWWAIASLTTVGYGDVYPITSGGKVFASVVLMIGIGIVAIPAGLLASALSEARRIEDSGSQTP